MVFGTVQFVQVDRRSGKVVVKEEGLCSKEVKLSKVVAARWTNAAISSMTIAFSRFSV